VERLAAGDIVWALTGSTSFVLQGFPANPHDIDVQTDEPCAFEIQKRLIESVVKPVVFSSTGHIRSYYGALNVQGISVEIMGDIQHRLPDGSWSPIPDLHRLRRFVRVDGFEVPVMDLAYEVGAYALMGRSTRAEEIHRWLAAGGADYPD
jgi:hypothetical protein